MTQKPPPLVYVVGPAIGPESFRDLVAIPGDKFPDPGQERRILKLWEPSGADVRFDPDGAISDQVGAIRWRDDTGLIELTYVTPAWRRKGVATALLGAARWFARDTGRPRVRSSQKVTALGVLWLASMFESIDFVSLLCDPMTPAADIEGVDRRLLVPDDLALVTGRVRRFMAENDIDSGTLGDLVDVVCGPAAGIPLSEYEVAGLT